MSTKDLLDALPDLVLLLQRDGVVLGSYGGRSVPELKPAVNPIGKHPEAVWPAHFAGVITHLTREAIVRREIAAAPCQGAGRAYDIWVSEHGSHCVICVIRAVLDPVQPAAPQQQESPKRQLHRRALLRRLNNSVSVAALRGTPAAVAVIHLDGVADIKQMVSAEIAAHIMSAAQLRLETATDNPARARPWCHIGQLGTDLSLLILATADRDEIDACIAQICDGLRQPIDAGPTAFQLTPYVGVAIMGQDAAAPNVLLELARAAATRARQTSSSRACFSSDAPGQLARDRVGIAHELRKAVANREIGLRYESRHELATGRLVARVGHLRWRHTVYGEIHPLELVRLAEITGLAADLSRAALKRLQLDFAAFAPQWGPGVRISFGAPKQHILHQDFIGDIERFLAEGIVPPERLELRISVKASVSREPAYFEPLTRRGVQLVVDDLGRGMELPLNWLARAPIRGLQLNRGWVSTIARDADAFKMCRAGVGIALALGLIPIANGVDDPARRDALLAIGCDQGIGELYRDELCPPDIITHPRTVAAA